MNLLFSCSIFLLLLFYQQYNMITHNFLYCSTTSYFVVQTKEKRKIWNSIFHYTNYFVSSISQILKDSYFFFGIFLPFLQEYFLAEKSATQAPIWCVSVLHGQVSPLPGCCHSFAWYLYTEGKKRYVGAGQIATLRRHGTHWKST